MQTALMPPTALARSPHTSQPEPLRRARRIAPRLHQRAGILPPAPDLMPNFEKHVQTLFAIQVVPGFLQVEDLHQLGIGERQTRDVTLIAHRHHATAFDETTYRFRDLPSARANFFAVRGVWRSPRR